VMLTGVSGLAEGGDEAVTLDHALLYPPPATEAELKQRNERSRQRQMQQDWPGATEDLLYFFDHSRNVGGWGGVRLSFTLGSLVQIGHHHPPARQELIRRRDVREQAIRQGVGGFDIVHEYAALERALEQRKRIIPLMDDLNQDPQPHTQALEHLANVTWEYLAEQNRYDLIKPVLESQIRSYRRHLFEIKDNPSFPFKQPRGRIVAFNHNKAMDDGPMLYEASLAVERFDWAKKVKRELLDYESSEETYLALIDAAKNAGDQELAKSIGQEAVETLPEDQSQSVRAWLSKHSEAP